MFTSATLQQFWTRPSGCRQIIWTFGVYQPLLFLYYLKRWGKNVVCHYTFASCISCFKFCTFYSFVGSCLVSIGIKADKNRTDLASSICCRFPYREINIPATFPTHVSGRAGGVLRISRDLTHSEQHVYMAAFPCIIAEMESMGRRRVRNSSVINQ